jgi:PadR family transcriptional regulator, regulatory protein PadR
MRSLSRNPSRFFRGGGSVSIVPNKHHQYSFANCVIDNHDCIYHNVVQMIGEFEYLILSSAARLSEDAYGASIRTEIENATGRSCSIGALYTTLDRLEKKGFVRTWMGDPTPQRGGRSKRLVRVTASGVKAAREFFGTVTRISKGASWATNRQTTR